MSRWKRDETVNEIELAAAVPDAVAVVEGGVLVGWDESAAQCYIAALTNSGEQATCYDGRCDPGRPS